MKIKGFIGRLSWIFFLIACFFSAAMSQMACEYDEKKCKKIKESIESYANSVTFDIYLIDKDELKNNLIKCKEWIEEVLPLVNNGTKATKKIDLSQSSDVYRCLNLLKSADEYRQSKKRVKRSNKWLNNELNKRDCFCQKDINK
jgi:hypothetical protein